MPCNQTTTNGRFPELRVAQPRKAVVSHLKVESIALEGIGHRGFIRSRLGIWSEANHKAEGEQSERKTSVQRSCSCDRCSRISRRSQNILVCFLGMGNTRHAHRHPGFLDNGFKPSVRSIGRGARRNNDSMARLGRASGLVREIADYRQNARRRL